MAIFTLFSNRNRVPPEIFQCEEYILTLRNQTIQIAFDCLGMSPDYPGTRGMKAFMFVRSTLCREYGWACLSDSLKDEVADVLGFFYQAPVKEALDVVHCLFKYIENNVEPGWSFAGDRAPLMTYEQGRDELNYRFRMAGFGYQLESGEIVKIDSNYTHSEILKPALALLYSKTFKGANDEFMLGLDHYKNGRYKDCLVNCAKAFESTMKIICKKKGWKYNDTDTAKRLIQVCFDNRLVPAYTQNQFTSLQNLLESGIPTIRNKTSGHGQGANPINVDVELTKYGMNLTASVISFLVAYSGIK